MQETQLSFRGRVRCTKSYLTLLYLWLKIIGELCVIVCPQYQYYPSAVDRRGGRLWARSPTLLMEYYKITDYFHNSHTPFNAHHTHLRKPIYINIIYTVHYIVSPKQSNLFEGGGIFLYHIGNFVAVNSKQPMLLVMLGWVGERSSNSNPRKHSRVKQVTGVMSMFSSGAHCS